MLHPLTPNGHLSLHNSLFIRLLLLYQRYPGCQRLFMHGFRFRLSLFKWSFFSRLPPSCFRPLAEDVSAADEASRRTREQTSDPGYPKDWLWRSLSKSNLASTCLYVLTVIRVRITKNGACGLSEKEFIIFSPLPIITYTGRLPLKGGPFWDSVYE